MVKNIAPKKQGDKNGLIGFNAQPIVHVVAFAQLIYSRIKLYQAKTVPAKRTKN